MPIDQKKYGLEHTCEWFQLKVSALSSHYSDRKVLQVAIVWGAEKGPNNADSGKLNSNFFRPDNSVLNSGRATKFWPFRPLYDSFRRAKSEAEDINDQQVS